ncbi:hypothetical protein GIW70_15230 [Pseudomonas syringae]|nr:hypothetical protein [Pseudomonas syringae]MCF5069542.1 hypothetical protein [Pseudomonas syringae]
MPAPSSPLLFPPVLDNPGLWSNLGKIHDLNTRDFEWLAHVKLATQALRNKQTPPMLAERILLTAEGETAALPLAGSFLLSATPDAAAVIFYSPYDGIKKYHSRGFFQEELQKRLDGATEQDDLLAFMASSQRKLLVEKRGITLTFETIDGDVFDDQRALVLGTLDLTMAALLTELKQMPPLTSMLHGAMDDLLETELTGVQQRQTLVSFHDTSVIADEHADTNTRHWLNSMSLGDAVLMRFRHQGWPEHQRAFFSNPGRTAAPSDQGIWSDAVKAASGKLPALLFRQLDRFWDAPCAEGQSRREFFGRALEDLARAELLFKRESNIIDAGQFDNLHLLIRPATAPARRPVIETVRLWEHEPNFVELAGSLMISDSVTALYTPSQGLQVLKDYQDLKDTLASKFTAAGHEDELYALLSLDEHSRFLGFKWPKISGEVIAGDIFSALFESMLTKQRQNIEHVLQVFRHSNGAVDIHPLFDKALDIRAMIHEKLSQLDADGRWSTRPVFFGDRQPSMVAADKAAAAVKTFRHLEDAMATRFNAQPIATAAAQRGYLEALQKDLGHLWSVGVRAEAAWRVQGQSLHPDEQAIVDTVFNPDHATRQSRLELNGFQPDAYRLTLKRNDKTDLLPLAHCVLLTERGGLDVNHSGRTILWTPAAGLEVFATVDTLRQTLDRRLLDRQSGLTLLENLEPLHREHHQRYSMGPLQLIDGNVLHERMGSAIEHFLARCERIRTSVKGDNEQRRALIAMAKTAIDSNLPRATANAKAINLQQLLPAWLAMAPFTEQQLHIELLEQWRHSVIDDKDYLDGIQPLDEYVQQTLKTLLDTRFPGEQLDPSLIEITPNLILAGPPGTLTEFALNHVNVAQNSGFKVSSKTVKALPAGLDQSAVKQLLLSLSIPTAYARQVSEALSATTPASVVRKASFLRQLPWQLLQHAHAMKLQHQLSDSAFDSLCQVLDMPDGLARATVPGAEASVCALSLIKTAGAVAAKALGMYLIGSGSDHKGPLVLYSAYDEQILREFESEAALVSALNTPGTLQDVLLRRLPFDQQAVFKSLFKSSVGTTSEITLDTSPITGNLLQQLFNDNLTLMTHLLSSQAVASAQIDWEAARHLFSKGVHLMANVLPGKLAYGKFLWQAYRDFKDSAEALQDHHWKKALKAFIDGAAQMVSVGRLAMETPTEPVSIESPQSDGAVVAQPWSHIRPTSPSRTRLQSLESTTVALKDMKKNTSSHIYEAPDKQTYAAIAGKVYPAIRFGEHWHLDHEDRGPALLKAGSVLVLDPDLHTVLYGKAMSRMHERYAIERDRRNALNIDAVGMNEIRRLFPHKAQVLVSAIDLARFYAFNSLHNLAVRKNVPVTRLDNLFQRIFDTQTIDDALLTKIHEAITPICKALVDPEDELMDTERFVIGSVRDPAMNAIAFVVVGDRLRKVNFTELFFDQQLDDFKRVTHPSFDVDTHAQAVTVIHELSHLHATVDLASMEARQPFSDLISLASAQGRKLKREQTDLRARFLSLATPRPQLFSYWSNSKQAWRRIKKTRNSRHAISLAVDAILDATNTTTMEDACDAFLDQNAAGARINVILRNADSLAWLISEMGRQLDPAPVTPKP